MEFANFNISLMRTALSMASLSIAIIGFATLFADKDMKMFSYAVKIIGGVLFLVSGIYGIQSTTNFVEYINMAKKNPDLSSSSKKEIDSFKVYAIYHYLYLGLLFVVALMFSYMKLPALQDVFKSISNE